MRMHLAGRAAFFLLAPAVLALLACARGEEIAADRAFGARWRDLAGAVTGEGPAQRFIAASALFLGTSYRDGPLGEGDAGALDPDPRVDFDRVDCVTYLEQALALALGPPAEDPHGAERFLWVLDRIRYRDGRVDFASRNHYMARDWVPANSWLAEDVTASVARGTAVSIVRRIDRAEFLRGKGATPRAGLDEAADLRLAIVPRESAGAVAAGIRDGDLVFWVAKRDGIDIAHTGLAVRGADGQVLFRHASSKAGRVVEEPLGQYAARASFAAGLMVLRLRPDAAARLAATAGAPGAD